MPFAPRDCNPEDRAERRAELFWAAIEACATLDDLEQRFGDDYIDVLARLNRGALHPHDAVRALRTEYRKLFLAETNRRTA